MDNAHNLCKCGRKKCKISKRCKNCMKKGRLQSLCYKMKYNIKIKEWITRT